MQLRTLPVDAATSLALIEERLADAGPLQSRLQKPNLTAVRESVGLFQNCLASLVTPAPVEAAPRWLDSVRHRTLLSSFMALRAFQARETSFAAALLLDAWSEEARRILEMTVGGEAESGFETAVDGWRRVVGQIREAMVRSLRESAPAQVERKLDESTSQLDDEWLLLYNQAVGEVLARDLEAGRARAAVRSLMTHLQVGQDELGRLFGVSGETVRRWERGAVEIPSQRQAEIFVVETSLRRLLEIFRPERLPVVVRREADLFEGETALEWILRGRIADVVDRYETAFLYQG